MRAYTIEIYEYGTRGNLFLRAPEGSVLKHFDMGFDGTVMVKTVDHEMFSLSDGGSIVGKYKILREIGSYIHEGGQAESSTGNSHYLRSPAPALRRMKNKSIAQFDLERSESSFSATANHKAISCEDLAFTDVDEELRVMSALYNSGNLYIGNYEIKAAVEMDTLMNKPICMRVFKSYFEELDQGK